MGIKQHTDKLNTHSMLALIEMKKLLFGILMGIILSLFYIMIDSVFNSREKIPKDIAFITIKNDSDFNIVNATLKHGYGEFTIKNIGVNNSAYIGFRNGSENSYQLFIQFENDSVLQTKGNYFEYGFRGLEIITNQKIISEDNW